MLYNRLKIISETKPNSIALVIDHERITYRDFLAEVNKLVAGFKKLGLSPGTSLSIMLEKNEVIWAAVIAASYLGVSVMLVDPNLKEQEKKQILEMYRTTYELQAVNCLSSSESCGDAVLTFSCFNDNFSLLNRGKAAECWSEYSIESSNHSYIVLLTSGSTKVPSAVVKTVESVVGDGERIGRSLGIGSSDQVICVAPVYHAFGLICGCFASFMSGAAVSFVGPYTLPSALESRVRDISATILMALPVHYKLLVQHVEQPFYHIRFALSSTAPLPKELLQACKDKLNLSIHNIYGSSEAGGISIKRNDIVDGLTSNVGQPIEGVQIKFDMSNSVEVDGKIVGELLINSPSLAKGYLKSHLDMDSFFLEDGWWRTGDLAYLNERDELNIAGRVNITINVNGKKVNPYEIEEILSKHPAIAETVVVGRPDEKRGEIPVAFVVLKEHISEQEILKFCYQKLSHYKVPRRIEFREELPKTSAGKVRRREVN
ncbi:acyl--CoA ligase [Paenibacillus dendritiformis]|uniref:class I adenylate-forming enzyme family protein n=1 Tax=Paenibacillus dendritiformis TaxID=130049 RepID=UPI00143CC529|nr:class I adenylate-forming enzyme family protein [Paenibacillus dendritiformis]NKI21918.1 acyl--CoA ligase [Paenibacillus dendritiformis]NRF97448.1 acyl--CoA ligase [Paenibacillus dendritiformis]